MFFLNILLNYYDFSAADLEEEVTEIFKYI